MVRRSSRSPDYELLSLNYELLSSNYELRSATHAVRQANGGLVSPTYAVRPAFGMGRPAMEAPRSATYAVCQANRMGSGRGLRTIVRDLLTSVCELLGSVPDLLQTAAAKRAPVLNLRSSPPRALHRRPERASRSATYSVRRPERSIWLDNSSSEAAAR